MHKRIPIFIVCVIMQILLVAPVQAYWTGEHKFIGDQAFIRAIANDPQKMKVWQTIVGNNAPGSCVIYLPNRAIKYISYGDLTALSGDHDIAIKELFQVLLQLYPDNWFSYNNAYYQKCKEDTTILKTLRKHYNTISSANNAVLPSGLSSDRHDHTPFTIEPGSHFYDFGTTIMSDELSFAVLKYIVIPEGKTKSLLEYQLFSQLQLPERITKGVAIKRINIVGVDSFFKQLEAENIASKYCVLHTIARECADLAGMDYAQNDNMFSQNGKLFMQLALLFNACADHYLQDAFASGHLVINHHNALSKYNNKGKHDYYNRIGLQVDNSEVSPWMSYGDGNLDTTQLNYQKIMQANKASLDDLWNRFYLHAKHPEQPTMIQEFNEKSEKQVVAMCQRHFNAMRYIPLPAESGQVNFANSKNGLFMGGVVGAPALYKYAPDVELQLGIGYNIINGTNHNAVKRESDLWAGASISLGYYSTFSQGATLHPLIRVNFPELNFFNLLTVEPLSYKCVYLQNKLIAIWNPAIGYERKRVTKNWSWSAKMYYQRLTAGLEYKLYPAVQYRYYF